MENTVKVWRCRESRLSSALIQTQRTSPTFVISRFSYMKTLPEDICHLIFSFRDSLSRSYDTSYHGSPHISGKMLPKEFKYVVINGKSNLLTGSKITEKLPETMEISKDEGPWHTFSAIGPGFRGLCWRLCNTI